MKKLVKLLLVLGLVLFTAFAAGSSVFADTDGEPVQEGETVQNEVTSIQDNEELPPVEVPEGEINKGNGTKVTEKIDIETEVIPDPDEETKTEEIVEIVEETESSEEYEQRGYIKDNDDKYVADPADLEVTVHPELGDEVVSINAEEFDKVYNYKIKDYVDKKIGDCEVVNNEDGTWSIKTDEITYKVLWYLDLSGWHYTIYDPDNDYDKIKITIKMDEMKIDENVIGDDKPGLDLKTDEINITIHENTDPDISSSKISDSVVIFDGENVDNFVEGYENAYDEQRVRPEWHILRRDGEGLTFDEINYVVKQVIEDEEEIEINPQTDALQVVVENGVVSLVAFEKGKYHVYLEGYYTENMFREESAVTKRVLLPHLDHIDYELRDGELHKMEYTHTGWGLGTKYYVTDTPLTSNSAWATFAKVTVNVKEAIAENIRIPGDDKWLTATENDDPGEGAEYIISKAEENGDKVVGYFDVDLYHQNTGLENPLPVEKLKGDKAILNEPVIVTLKVDADKVKVPDGFTPAFTVYYIHNNEEPEAITPIRATLVNGEWVIEFEANKFSLYSVAYKNVANPRPHHSEDGYQFVNTGVTETVQTVDYTGYISLVAGMALVVIALRKRLAD